MGVMDYRAMGFDQVRAQYKAYLMTQGLSANTISTAYTDTFYLWRKAGRETFWSVLESNNFERDARAALLDALRSHSRGDAESLVGGYLNHLRRFRRFLGRNPEGTPAVSGRGAGGPRSPGAADVPKPSPEQVLYYLRRWNELENYRSQELALDKLFHRLCPENQRMEDILLKAAALNEFYSTNIFSIFPVAKHILNLDIDARLREGDLTLVEDLRTVVLGGKTRQLYSFASKYCSHHNERDYPIYDSYVDAVLRYFRTEGRFARFANRDLKDYRRFKEILTAFRSCYGLDQFSLKEVDQYLWQLGKDFFPKSY